MTTANDIAAQLEAEHGMTKVQGKAMLDSVLKAITEAALRGEEVSLPGFGKFKVKASPEREGRNPATGATLTIAASKKLTFTPAKALKDSLNN